MLMMDRNMVDAASGGALMNKTPMAARHLISNMVSNTQQFGIRGGADTSRVVREVSMFDNQRLENQLKELTSLVRQLVVGQHQQVVQREVGTNMGGSRIRTDSSIISNFGDNHTNRIQIKRNIQHQGLDQLGPCQVRVKPIISNRDQDTRHHHFVNNRISKCHRGRIIP
ncbi:hypothetical protein CR513_31164, partial [Mucuna pruriens]